MAPPTQTMSKYTDLLKEGEKKDPSEDYDARPELQGVISQESFEFINAINEQTGNLLGEEWASNVKTNKRWWRKHSSLLSCKGLGKNKCVIGIGASPGFHNNKDVLKQYVNNDGVQPWEYRDFITIAANHQYKPLLEFGIIPDFVLLVDASDVVMDQLCKDIPPEGQNTTLITGVHCSPRVIKEWTKQGRHIVFYTSGSPQINDAFREHIKRDPVKHKMDLGGNCLNGAFMIGTMIFDSTVFMGVGNDLSFPIKDTIEEQRKGYYSDGDYSSNIAGTGTGRDEAAGYKKWGGFKLTKRHVIMPQEQVGSYKRYNIQLDLVGTSKTLWVYKNWLEATIMGQTKHPTYLNYFNCTESGILGVMARESHDDALKDVNNWFMLDEVCINQHTNKAMYHTAMLQDAIEVFLDSKRKLLCQNVTANQLVQSAEGMATQGLRVIA